MIRVSFFAVVLLASVVDVLTLYEGYRVIRVTTDKPELVLRSILRHNELHKLHIWDTDTDPTSGRTVFTFHVNPNLLDETVESMKALGMQYEVIIENLQSVIEEENFSNKKNRKEDDPFSFYYNFEELQVFLAEQAVLCGSNCQIIKIGDSYQGNPLNVLKMIGEPKEGCDQKPSIWIDAGIHAREWISVSTAQFLINRLIEEYDTDPFVKEMRDTYDWFFLPSINPDGYTYTWTTDRMWRKTRQSFDGTSCVGTDCNRNFDFQWMTIGASSDPCSETFAGPQPNSEPEAAAVSEFLLARSGTWELFITLHSYGQLWMSPYGYTKTLPDNYESLERVGLSAVQAIRDTTGTVYRFGNAASILYESSGTSRDWAAGVTQIPFVYTIELRSLNSFVLPPTEIRPTGEEIWAGLKATVAAMRQERPTVCIDPPQ